MVQLIKSPTSAQAMISEFTSSSPAPGSALTAQSLEPASDLCLPLSLCPSPARILSVSLSEINIKFFFNNNFNFSESLPSQKGGSTREEIIFLLRWMGRRVGRPRERPSFHAGLHAWTNLSLLSQP